MPLFFHNARGADLASTVFAYDSLCLSCLTRSGGWVGFHHIRTVQREPGKKNLSVSEKLTKLTLKCPSSCPLGQNPTQFTPRMLKQTLRIICNNSGLWCEHSVINNLQLSSPPCSLPHSISHYHTAASWQSHLQSNGALYYVQDWSKFELANKKI